MQIWAESGKSALPICNYSQILYQFLTFTQNLKRSLYKTCGLRIGTQEISRYGWTNKEMNLIAEILRDIRDNDTFSQDISKKINNLSSKKEICFTIDNDCYNKIYTYLHNC